MVYNLLLHLKNEVESICRESCEPDRLNAPSRSVLYRGESVQEGSPATLPSLAVVIAYSDVPKLLPLRFASAILIACGSLPHG